MKQNKPSGAASTRFDPQTLRRIAMAALSVILALSIALCAVSVRNYFLRKHVIDSFSGLLQVESVYPLEIDAKKERELLQKTPRRHGQVLRFKYTCGAYVAFDTPEGEGAILFGNVPSNDCTLVFSVVDENGILLYRSAGVAPGMYVSLIRLLHAPAYGAHRCRLYVAAFAPETNEFIGVQYSKLTVQIGG